MLDFKEKQDPKTGKIHIETTLRGKAILNIPQLNKGTAFTREERLALGLFGKLPARIEPLEAQVRRCYFQLQNQETRLHKYIFLNNILDKNHVLFFRLLENHLEELLPIIYTPTVSTAVKVFSQKFRQPRGLYINYENQDYIEAILDNRSNPNIDLIVVTDGEGVLGIGDQGIGAMEIPIAKLSAYTLLGGVNPARTLPIMLDVGTDNEALLNDPMYLGWQHKRIRDKQYDLFIEKFIKAVRKKFPHVFLHWEDLGRENAQRVLDQYHDKLCTFNDDIQGTGIVALAALLASSAAKNEKLTEQRVVIFGAGSAGVGIAHQLCCAMQSMGLSEQEARQQFWLIDRQGLLLEDSIAMNSQQQVFARNKQEVTEWEATDLLNTIKNVKPTVLIGTSSLSGAFNETVVKTMAANVERPVIMPLSNPTKNAEAKPQNLLQWTEGKALIATGSPFVPAEFQEHIIPIAQCNNALVFPGIGLGLIAVKAKRLTKDMLLSAAQALAAHAPIQNNSSGMLLPPINKTKSISYEIAFAIAKQAIKEKLADKLTDKQLQAKIASIVWEAQYPEIKAV